MEKSRKILEQILSIGKPAYGTPEYWEKERKSKYRRNARHYDNIEKQIAEGIISMWTMTPVTDVPLLKMSDNIIANATKTSPEKE